MAMDNIFGVIMYYGYVYIWFDVLKRKFCVGSHHGCVGDSYTTSTGHCAAAIKKRPHTFRFRVLELNTSVDDFRYTQKLEERWLGMIRDDELGVKYYNRKRVASGGDIYSTLSVEKRESHRTKSGDASKNWWAGLSDEEMDYRRKIAFGGNKFDRSYLKSDSYRQTMSLATTGERNGFYGKTHNDLSKRLMSERKIGNTNRAKHYRIIFPNGDIDDTNFGQKQIISKYGGSGLKWSRFIDSNTPITSNRLGAKEHPLYGCIIESIE